MGTRTVADNRPPRLIPLLHRDGGHRTGAFGSPVRPSWNRHSMTAGGNSDARNRRKSEEELQIRPLSEHVGAEISGVNLATDLADDTFEKIDVTRCRCRGLPASQSTSPPHTGRT